MNHEEKPYEQRMARRVGNGMTSFRSDDDIAAELEVGKFLEKKWGCKLHAFALYSPIDFWAEKDGKVMRWVELKTSQKMVEEHTHVFLNMRKWGALMGWVNGTEIPAIVVYSFDNALGTIFAHDIDARSENVIIGGHRKVVKSMADIEPMIKIPIDKLTMFKDWIVAGPNE